jgi:hypothetical protein
MELAYAFLAEAIEVNEDGRFIAFGGGIESVRGKSLPAVLPSVAVIAKIRVPKEECQREHHLRVSAVDPEGRAIVHPFDAVFGPLMEPVGIREETSHVVGLTFREMTLKSEGVYSFRVCVDDIELGSANLTVETPPRDDGQTVREEHDAELRASESATSTVIGPESDAPSRRQLLQQKMPPRERIEAIIKRLPARDPWLDDEYDWQL